MIKARESWGSRFGYLMVVTGAMVGAGNIWRMPYVTGENGGGAFLVACFVLLYLVVIPGLMAETALGRYTQRGVIGTFRAVLGQRRWVGFGLVVVLVNMVMMSYYSPVVGWSLYYASKAVTGSLVSQNTDPGALWAQFSADVPMQIAMHTLAMAIVVFILVLGIRGGIQRMATWMMPCLLVGLAAVAIRGLTLPGAVAGLQFSFQPDWEYLLRGSTWLAALGQVLFSNGLGWGIALTLGSYLKKNDDIPLGGGVFTAVGNTTFGLLAIFAVFPVVFAFGISPTSGSQLAFVALASAFTKMPAGYLWSILFFVGFLFANITTAIAITEVGVTTLSEETGLSRKKTVIGFCLLIWAIGLPSAINSDVVGYLDFVLGNFGLPLTTLLIVILAGWAFGANRLRLVSVNRGANFYVPEVWNLFVRYVIPAVFIFIMVVFFASGIASTPLRVLTGIAALAVTVVLCLLLTSANGRQPFTNVAASEYTG